MFWQRTKKPSLSIVVVFFNMCREAPRTLHTLTTAYQQGVDIQDYEVIAIDSGSSEPLDPSWVEGLQANFHHYRIRTRWPTPCEAMNHGIEMAKADRVVCMIDGARMLSPSVLERMMLVYKVYPNAYVYTLAFHLGHKLQNIAMSEDGYCQTVEDRLLGSVDWRQDGYSLFDISCAAGSSRDGYLWSIGESNCFSVSKHLLKKLGGFDERFRSRGGGFVNLDIHRQLMEHPELQPVLLLGEGSFHQFHGGVATNTIDKKDLIEEFNQEYFSIRGVKYAHPSRQPCYFGEIHPKSRRFLDLYDPNEGYR